MQGKLMNVNVIADKWILVQVEKSGKLSIAYLGEGRIAPNPCVAPAYDHRREFFQPYQFCLDRLCLWANLNFQMVVDALRDMDTDELDAVYRHHALFYNQHQHYQDIHNTIGKLLDRRLEYEFWESEAKAALSD